MPPIRQIFFSCVEETIVRALPQEVDYLQKYDIPKSFVNQYIDMPDRTADLLITFLNQNNGQKIEESVPELSTKG